MASYAFLGAEHGSLALDGLEVTVPVTAVGPSYTSSLALKLDDVRLGMRQEYVEAVFAGVQKTGEVIGLPTNASLRFRWAAHAKVGSSRSIFEAASGLILRLLMLTTRQSEEQIAALFD